MSKDKDTTQPVTYVYLKEFNCLVQPMTDKKKHYFHDDDEYCKICEDWERYILSLSRIPIQENHSWADRQEVNRNDFTLSYECEAELKSCGCIFPKCDCTAKAIATLKKQSQSPAPAKQEGVEEYVKTVASKLFQRLGELGFHKMSTEEIKSWADQIIIEGASWQRSNEGDAVLIDILGWYQGKGDKYREQTLLVDCVKDFLTSKNK